MPTVDIWGVLNGVKNVAAIVWDSRILRIGIISAFIVGAFTTFLSFWSGLAIPTVDISSVGIPTDFNDTFGIMQIFLYVVHADYCVVFVNWIITLFNVVVPFLCGLLFTAMIFKFGLAIKSAIGYDIRSAT